MEFHKIIEERKSIREFKEKNLENEVIYALQEFGYTTDQLVDGISTSFYFVEEGHKVHEYLLGNAGYHGMAIDAPHYLFLLSEVEDNHIKNAGFIMEQALLKAFELKVGSCWVDVLEGQVELKKKLEIDKKGEIVAIAALGYPKTNIFGIETSVSDRQSIEELVFHKKWGQLMDVEELQQWGLEEVFYYVRHAPSWGNIQPWKFIIDNNMLILNMKKHSDYIEAQSKDNNHDLDCGIMMLYIQKMMHKKGIRGQWNLDVEEIDKEKYNIPKEQEIMGWFPI